MFLFYFYVAIRYIYLHSFIYTFIINYTFIYNIYLTVLVLNLVLKFQFLPEETQIFGN